MPIGPSGEKRPADLIANVVHVARIATRETGEEYVNLGRCRGGQRGGKGRIAAALDRRFDGIGIELTRSRRLRTTMYTRPAPGTCRVSRTSVQAQSPGRSGRTSP